MEGTALLQLPEEMWLDQIQITEICLVIKVVATHPTSRGPLCSESSSSIHCHYHRTLRDVPCAGRQVQLLLTVRKFTCRNPYCEQKVTASRLPDFVEPWARMTIRLPVSGSPLAEKGGLDWLLAWDTNHPSNDLTPHHESPRCLNRIGGVLSIDDFSFRCGYRFGTIFVNLELMFVHSNVV
jgi:hypothetical protein